MIAGPQVRLRSIGPADLEDLRTWKNANARWFFHKDPITPEQQRRWFEGYLGRANDHMFIVEAGALRAGCLGFRTLEDGSVDCYNIIAAPEGKGKGLLKAGMAALCSYALRGAPKRVMLVIVSDNPARGFYEKCGFRVVGPHEGGTLMELQPSFTPPEVEALRYYDAPVELSALAPGKGLACEVEPGVELVVYKDAHGVHAFRDLCPHMGAPMSEGRWDEKLGRLTCPWHGYEFDARTGKLARNPNEETFACMRGLYASYNPAKRPDLKMSPLQVDVEGALAWVRRP